MKTHASSLQLDIHVAFYQAVEHYRSVSGSDDVLERNAAAKATTRLVDNADHLLCATPQEKHAMLHTLESIRGTKDAPHAAFDSLKKDSERVIEDTIMASFKGCGAYTGEMAVDQMVDMGLKVRNTRHACTHAPCSYPHKQTSHRITASNRVPTDQNSAA